MPDSEPLPQNGASDENDGLHAGSPEWIVGIKKANSVMKEFCSAIDDVRSRESSFSKLNGILARTNEERFAALDCGGAMKDKIMYLIQFRSIENGHESPISLAASADNANDAVVKFQSEGRAALPGKILRCAKEHDLFGDKANSIMSDIILRKDISPGYRKALTGAFINGLKAKKITVIDGIQRREPIPGIGFYDEPKFKSSSKFDAIAGQIRQGIAWTGGEYGPSRNKYDFDALTSKLDPAYKKFLQKMFEPEIAENRKLKNARSSAQASVASKPRQAAQRLLRWVRGAV